LAIVACGLFLFAACDKTDNAQKPSPGAEGNDSPRKETEIAAAKIPVKEAYYRLSLSDKWDKPVKTGKSEIITIRLGACTSTITATLANPVQDEWIADFAGMSLQQHLDRIQQEIMKKPRRTLIGQQLVDIGGREAGYVEYNQDEGGGQPASHARMYTYLKDDAVVTLLVSATKACWDAFLPTGEEAANSLEML
jgi:hypothetical protein